MPGLDNTNAFQGLGILVAVRIAGDDDTLKCFIGRPCILDGFRHRSRSFARAHHQGPALRRRWQVRRNDNQGVGRSQRSTKTVDEKIAWCHGV